MGENISPVRGLRVALEGCVGHLYFHSCYHFERLYTNKYKGHGTLNDIYAAVEESAKLKGWDSVDLVIIGGDFQVGTYALIFLFSNSFYLPLLRSAFRP
jgi:hypothetical protein